MTSYAQTLTETISLTSERGIAGETSLYIKNSNGQWIEYLDYEYFKIVRKQNQVSEFEISIANIESSDKAFVKEFAEVIFLSEKNLILKGRIQKITYETSYSCKIKGFGMESLLLDKELIKAGDKRVQYTNKSAKSVAMDCLVRQEQTEEYETYAHTNIDSLVGSVGSGMRYAQTFTVGTVSDNEEFPLSFIELVMVRAGAGWTAGDESYPGMVYFELKAVDGAHKPTGDVLSFGQINGNELPRFITDALATTLIPMSAFLLKPNTEYALIVYCDTSTPQDIWGVALDISSPTYTGGAYVESGDSGGSWTVDATKDLTFKIFGGTLIMKPGYLGLFSTDYGDISLRFEYANRLKALAKLSGSLINPSYQVNYDWWVSQSPADDYNLSYFEIAPLRPTTTRATVSQETFAITGASANAVETFYEKDITNLANKIDVLGYGDGINQIHTSTYNASPIYSTLSADISSTATTIGLTDASSFASSGTIRIMEEQITYTGKTGNDLTGCSRGANSTTAYEHKKGVYVEKYVAIDSAEADSSISDNGLMDYSITDRELLDLPTAESIASKILLERMTAIIRIRVIPDEPLQTAGSREIGDLVTVTDAESGISGDYRIVGMTYTSDYGNLNMELELSNKTLNFIDQMAAQKEEADRLSKYMQGSTNIYAIGEAENCDDSNYLNMRFYLPADAVAINSVKLNFKLKDYRTYAQSITRAPVFSQNMGAWFSSGQAFMKGNFTTQSNCVSGLSFDQTSGFAKNLSTTSGMIRGAGSWSAYNPDKFVDEIDGEGHTTMFWNLGGAKGFVANDSTISVVSAVTGWSSQSLFTGVEWTNNSLVNGWTNATWSYPLWTQTTAKNISGTFDRIKVNFTVHNGYNETKTPTILFKRDGGTIATLTPTINAWGYYHYEWEDTTDYRGSVYRVEIGSSGFNVNHTTLPDTSYIMLNVATYLKSTDDLDFGIYEETLTSPSVDVYVGEDGGSMTKQGTYTADKIDLEITKLVSAVGINKWVNVQFRPNKRMRIEANSYIKIFIEST